LCLFLVSRYLGNHGSRLFFFFFQDWTWQYSATGCRILKEF
jgi:hypothetical protein